MPLPAAGRQMQVELCEIPLAGAPDNFNILIVGWKFNNPHSTIRNCRNGNAADGQFSAAD
jgi:hypothetical protein